MGKSMKMRKGVILFVTLMMIILLLGIVTVFLHKTKESKDSVTEVYAMIQTNIIMDNLLQYLKKVNFDETTIFYASQAPFPVNFGQSNVTFQVDSSQKYININSFVKNSIKDNLISQKFISLLLTYKIKDPNFFLDLLKDTLDKDTTSRNSTNSEIILEHPTFRNEKIYNSVHLSQIIEYYFDKTSDGKIYDVPFDEIFSYVNASIDVNFISAKLMKIIFDDANDYTLRIIEEHPDIYEKIDDLPFDKHYLKKIKKGILGQSFTTKTTNLKIDVVVHYKTQFESKISFLYNIKSKKIFDYTILSIEIGS